MGLGLRFHKGWSLIFLCVVLSACTKGFQVGLMPWPNSLQSSSIGNNVVPVMINVNDNVQSIINSNPPGTTYEFNAGIYRLIAISPQAGDTYLGETGVVFNGSKILTNFTQSGNIWVIGGQTQRGRVHGQCQAGFPMCAYPDDVFFDNQPLLHVGSVGAVVSGTFFFDYVNSLIYIGNNPAGHLVEAATTRVAFSPTADNVTIKGFTIEKYSNEAQAGAIGDYNAGQGWDVENNEVRLTHGVGIKVGGNNSVMIGNFVHNNGQLGVAVSELGGSSNNGIVERNEISANNYAGHDPGWEAGASKFWSTTNLKVRCNYVHDNLGPGLWTDTDNLNTLYDQNIVISNAGMGIVHEVSYAAIISNNIVKWNSQNWFGWLYGAQILSSVSENVEITGNSIEVAAGGGVGIGVIQQARGTAPDGSTYLAINNWVHGNTITFLADISTNSSVSGSPAVLISGAAVDITGTQFWAPGNIRFDYNTYHAPSLSVAHWAWNGATLDWSDYKATGQDTHGYADTNVELDTTAYSVPATCP